MINNYRKSAGCTYTIGNGREALAFHILCGRPCIWVHTSLFPTSTPTYSSLLSQSSLDLSLSGQLSSPLSLSAGGSPLLSLSLSAGGSLLTLSLSRRPLSPLSLSQRAATISSRWCVRAWSEERGAKADGACVRGASCVRGERGKLVWPRKIVLF